MNVLGIDIGTTTLCALLADSVDGSVTASATVANDSFVRGLPYEKLQDPDKILQKVRDLIDEIGAEHRIDIIGLTGQMHGILYVDAFGRAVSPLYTWQDGSGNESSGAVSFSDELFDLTGRRLSSGFGALTLFCHTRRGTVPESAAKICAVHDYVAMRLCGARTPLTHISDAASFGLFDLDTNSFDLDSLNAASLDVSLFPRVAAGAQLVGSFGSMPVAVAIGDNQASFIGSVRDFEGALLVNVGTGAQISLLNNGGDVPPLMEARPLYDDKKLLVGSSLCGGSAYALLAGFVSSVVTAYSGSAPADVYSLLNDLADKADDTGLVADTRFNGTRQAPGVRGAVSGITTDNFTLGDLSRAFLKGIIDELKAMLPAGVSPSLLIGSGNAMRRNRVLRRLASDAFSAELNLPRHCEEAAFGAALFAMSAAGEKKSVEEACGLICYEG